MSDLMRGTVTKAMLVSRKMMGADLPPLSFNHGTRRLPTNQGTDKWIVQIRTYMNQDCLKIEECVPHKGAMPSTMTRFVALLDCAVQGVPVVQRIPIAATSLEEAFALYKTWLLKLMAEQAKAQEKKDADGKADPS